MDHSDLSFEGTIQAFNEQLADLKYQRSCTLDPQKIRKIDTQIDSIHFQLERLYNSRF